MIKMWNRITWRPYFISGQVEDVKKEGDDEKDKDKQDDKPDVEDEKEGIEMSDDFDGKLHDMDPAG